MNKKEIYNYCVLQRVTTAEEAFRIMSGVYSIGDCCFGVFNDSEFERFLLTNAIGIVFDYNRGSISIDDLISSFATSEDSEVKPSLLPIPFILWSEKGGAYYIFHFDSEIHDVTDADFEKAYLDLIGLYDIPEIIKRVCTLVGLNNKKISMKEQWKIIDNIGLVHRKNEPTDD